MNIFEVIHLELCALKLINFDCSSNRLTRLPLNLREMNSLIELNVDHNPLEIPPANVSSISLIVQFSQISFCSSRSVHLVYFISCASFLSKR